MPNYPGDFQGHELYATSTVLAYSLPSLGSSLVSTFVGGSDIGNIDSWAKSQDGTTDFYWQIYPNNDLTKQPFYILNDPYSLSVPSMTETLNNFTLSAPSLPVVDSTPPIGQTIAEGLSDLGSGVSNFFGSISTYLPWIAIGIAAIIIYPKIKDFGKKK